MKFKFEMMKNPLFLMLMIFALASCSETKTTASSASASTPTVSEADMTAQGFVAGVIHATDKDSGCPYTIETKKVTYLLDPINLGNEFMKDGLQVWFKFHPLRMQSRCSEATPVDVSEMQVRN